jgi:hypothetical protein
MSTMVEEPEKPDECKKLGLAAAIASGKSISRWAKENGVPKSTACRWAQDSAMRIEAQAVRRRMLDRVAGTMIRRCAFAAGRINALASDAQSESVQLNAAKLILTESMRIATYSDLEARMAEFEEELRRDPTSFAPLPPKR